jgi:hypothetical protein
VCVAECCVPVIPIDRFVYAAHDLCVLRHRPRSIPQPQDSARASCSDSPTASRASCHSW